MAQAFAVISAVQCGMAEQAELTAPRVDCVLACKRLKEGGFRGRFGIVEALCHRC
jgi:hypothetical protein